jgi:uncharacterized protein YkwD
MSEITVPYLHDGFGTGALWRPPDKRDYDMRLLPGVRHFLTVGYPESDEHLVEHDVYTYNQGASPSCVSHATAGVMTSNEHIERKGELLIFDAMGLHNETGPANQGRYPGDILKVAQDRGVLQTGTSKRRRIGSYAFAPRTTPEEWEATLKAAIAAGHVCMLALRLPSTFGWESGGSLLGWETYHDVKLIAYRRDAFLVKNSWGQGWGQQGRGWIPIAFLTQQNFQEMAVIGNTILDAIDDDLAPSPTPTPTPQPPQPPTPQPPTPQPPTPQPPTPTPDPSGFAAEVFRLQNQARAAAGLPALQLHPALTRAAQNFAQWMGANNQYGHEADGKQPIERMIAAGLPASGWSNWGENIAAGQSEPGAAMGAEIEWRVSSIKGGEILNGPFTSEHVTPGGAMTDWLNSPGHRANILFPAFTHCGVGVAEVPGSQYRWYWVVDFVSWHGDVPTPGGLRIDGYEGTDPGGTVRAGSKFVIRGQGFGESGNLDVMHGAVPLTVVSRRDTLIEVIAPAYSVMTIAPVSVRVERNG